jgi:hypothetical protein
LSDVSEVRAAYIISALMMEVVRTSETSVNFKETTRGYIPEYSKLYTRRRENLESHELLIVKTCGTRNYHGV